jgi:hypothetical protein
MYTMLINSSFQKFMLVLITLECLVITPYKFRFIQYISIQASAQKVISFNFTNTRYTEHNRSTIGSAPIIAYRCHYGFTVITVATMLTTHKGVGRASPSRSEYTDSRSHSGGINLIRCGMLAKVPKIAVASSSYEQKVSGIRITKKFAAQATPGTGRRWPVGNTMLGEDVPCWGIIL